MTFKSLGEIPTLIRPDRMIVRRVQSRGIEAGRTIESTLRRAGFSLIAGADEAGRGSCAGPLVAAACILPAGRRGTIAGLTDSKLLTAAARERLYDLIVDQALAWQVVTISAPTIDRIRLHVANVQAMRRAVAALRPLPMYTLTDGFPVDGLPGPALAIWKGDQVAACIAAASILAKVSRDRMMVELHKDYPEYGFDVHKGYNTAEHHVALAKYGPCEQHRHSYANVRRVIDESKQSGVL